MDIFQAKLEHLLAQKREWAEFFQAQSRAEQQGGGGSNRDLVLLFAFAGEMPGVPFSCAAAVKGFFSLLQRFGQVAPWVVANRILFDPGATVTLNFFKKSMPRMGPATAACKKEC
jgi:hypothetical protein